VERRGGKPEKKREKKGGKICISQRIKPRPGGETYTKEEKGQGEPK